MTKDFCTDKWETVFGKDERFAKKDNDELVEKMVEAMVKNQEKRREGHERFNKDMCGRAYVNGKKILED